jgi:hypothetical protein
MDMVAMLNGKNAPNTANDILLLVFFQHGGYDVTWKPIIPKQEYSNLRPSTNRKHFRAFVYV